MKIWHLTKSFEGGAGQYALRLSNALSAQGLISEVVVAQGQVVEGSQQLIPSDSLIRKVAARGVRSLSGRLAHAPYHSLRRPDLYEACESIKPGDIVHLHGMTGWIGVSGLRRLIPHGARVFWTAHDLWMFSGGCVVYQGCKRFRNDCRACPILKTGFKLLARSELRMKQEIFQYFRISPIANSEWTQSMAASSNWINGEGRIPVVPPIVDEVFLSSGSSNLRKNLGISPSSRVIGLGANQLTAQFKGIPEFLDALCEAKTMLNLTIFLFGDGTLEIPANLKVHSFGPIVSRTDLRAFYEACDIFVSPSRMETFGMTLLEAQATGTQVAAFRVGGVPEAIYPEWHRYLAEPEDYESLVNIVMSYLESRAAKPNQVGVREWVQRNFSSEVIGTLQFSAYNL